MQKPPHGSVQALCQGRLPISAQARDVIGKGQHEHDDQPDQLMRSRRGKAKPVAPIMSGIRKLPKIVGVDELVRDRWRDDRASLSPANPPEGPVARDTATSIGK